MNHDLSILTEEQRQERARVLDAGTKRYKRYLSAGVVEAGALEKFIAETNVKFGLVSKVQAQDTVVEGATFGKLTVRSFGKNAHGQTTAICDCACGKVHEANISKIGSGYTKSCGCLRERVKRGDALSSVTASIKATYKSTAKTKGLVFALSHEDVQELITADCFYCGTKPYRVWSITYKSGVRSLACNGMDRVDNGLGYLLSNVVPCCPRCNYAKRDMPVSEFIAWLVTAAHNLQQKSAVKSPDSKHKQLT